MLLSIKMRAVVRESEGSEWKKVEQFKNLVIVGNKQIVSSNMFNTLYTYKRSLNCDILVAPAFHFNSHHSPFSFVLTFTQKTHTKDPGVSKHRDSMYPS